MNEKIRELPNSAEHEKKLLSAMTLEGGKLVPKVAEKLTADDFSRIEHKLIFRAILSAYKKHGSSLDLLLIQDELDERVSLSYFWSVMNAEFTTARADTYINIIKEQAKLRKIIELSEIIIDESTHGDKSSNELLAIVDNTLSDWQRTPPKTSRLPDYFAHHLKTDIDALKNYANRTTGFCNVDERQFFSPGLYVIGGTPAAGKTTFCWQLLEQLAQNGETCIYCSYEMSAIELFTKTAARHLFLRDDKTALSAAQIRRGGASRALDEVILDLANSGANLSVLELQDESVDELLALLKPLCSDKTHAPVVCLDYLQIVPTSRDSAKLGIDDSVRKLKKFQRDTNTTFIVISSFNRTNYTQPVSFESFKESGNIEYTADVVWALQLNVLNDINSGNLADARQKINDAKEQQPRQVQLKCIKNRQGTNYDCFFSYHSAHDYFVPCEKFNVNKSNASIPPPKRSSD